MELSRRLMTVAGLVTEGAVAADVGTDHGYVPIYLTQKQRCPHMIAMDIHTGPLERAREHIREHGLEDRIETRLSDGLAGLNPGEADTVIAAGMGGRLVIQILRDSPKIVESVREFILQPQSDIHKVRAYLNENGFFLTEEDMIEEEGKFYPVMKLKHGYEPAYSEQELYFGRLLLKQRNFVLYRFLQREKNRLEKIWEDLREKQGERAALRRRELETEIARIRRGLSVYQGMDDCGIPSSGGNHTYAL